jgi:hypothetical protein
MLTAKHLFGVRDLDHDPARLGQYAVYRPNRPNPCPNCGQSQWIVGRVSAECAVCATALPLVEASMSAENLLRRVWQSAENKSLAA